MREILFRGQNIDYNWVFGGYVFISGTTMAGHLCKGGKYIIDEYGKPHEVNSATIGEYTGMKDSKGVKIFEGDILSVNGKYPKIVEYAEDRMSFCLINIEELKHADWKDIKQVPGVVRWNDFKREILVIGNIHDNPEMLNSE